MAIGPLSQIAFIPSVLLSMTMRSSLTPGSVATTVRVGERTSRASMRTVAGALVLASCLSRSPSSAPT